MPEPSPSAVLHALRVGGVAPAPRIGARLGCSVTEVQVVLQRQESEGLASRHAGSLPGWGLTPRGRRTGEEMLAAELDRLGARERVEDAYADFLAINGAVLTACSDWQVVAGSDPVRLNDHADVNYDAEVLRRLGRLHADAEEMLDALSTAVGRFGAYPPRLGRALARAETGGVDWVTRPVIDSFHTVWFELHEDLLATLGRTRQDERGQPREDRAGTAAAGGPDAAAAPRAEAAAGLRTEASAAPRREASAAPRTEAAAAPRAEERP